MRLTTLIFGVSELSVRLPALFGTAVYLTAAAYLTLSLTTTRARASALYLALTLNPLLMDFFVAARGYSLAVGFLTATLACLAFIDRVESWKLCAVASGLSALSFCANFSFAVVNFWTLIAILAISWRQNPARNQRLRCLAAIVLPGAVITLATVAPTAFHFPRSELAYGATSLKQMFGSVLEASVYKPNEFLIGKLMLKADVLLKLLLIPAALICLAAGERTFKSILLLTVASHWAAFHWGGVLLPMDRTAIWLVPMLTLIAASARWRPTLFLGMLALYYCTCLRLTYFKEWQFNADVRQVYEVLADSRRENPEIGEIPINWRFASALNFYRCKWPHAGLERFDWKRPMNPGMPLYVLSAADEKDAAFLEREKLTILYKGEASDVVVAAPATFSTEIRSTRSARPYPWDKSSP